MAGFGTKRMGQAQIPLEGNINLVQAKEVNTLIKWLNLQLGKGVLEAMNRDVAIVKITQLVEERAQNYYLMTLSENLQRMAVVHGGNADMQAVSGFTQQTEANAHLAVLVEFSDLEAGFEFNNDAGTLKEQVIAHWRDIRQLYKRAVSLHHPDRPNGNRAKFIRVDNAYKALENIKETSAQVERVEGHEVDC